MMMFYLDLKKKKDKGKEYYWAERASPPLGLVAPSYLGRTFLTD
jgi:hypothetical protein